MDAARFYGQLVGPIFWRSSHLLSSLLVGEVLRAGDLTASLSAFGLKLSMQQATRVATGAMALRANAPYACSGALRNHKLKIQLVLGSVEIKRK